MPVPPRLPVSLVLPNRLMMSARPSWLVSRSATMNPPGGDFLVESYGDRQVLTYRSPFGFATACRAPPMVSAKTDAVNPAGTVMPDASVETLAASGADAEFPGVAPRSRPPQPAPSAAAKTTR